MGYLLTHYPLTSLLLDLTIDESDDAVMHVDRPAAHQRHPLLLLKGQFQVKVFTEILFLELEFWRQLLRFHGSEWYGVYLGRGAFISMSSVSASKLCFDML